MATTVPVTTNYEVSEPAKGQYEVKEVAAEEPAELNSGNREEFNFDVGPLSVVGYYDPDTRTIGIYPKVFGRQIGDGYSAGLDTGLGVQLVLGAYNGSIRINKDGGALRAYVHLKPLLPWGSDLNYDAKLFNL